MTGRWAGRPCLVTGGAGFGGRHLVALLRQLGAHVVVLDQAARPAPPPAAAPPSAPPLEHVTGDIRDAALVRRLLRTHRIEVVFHLAAEAIVAESLERPYDVLDVNARGTFTLLEACRTERPDVLFVLASSGAYYGEQSSPTPLAESCAPRPAANLYAASKAAADLATQDYARAFGMRAATCRFMNTYGPGDRHLSRLVPRAHWLIERGAPYDFGDRDDGTTRLDFLYVGDMAAAYVRVAEHLDAGGGGAFNIGSGISTSVHEVALLASRTYDGRDRTPIFRGPRKEPGTQKWLDITRAREVLGWAPAVGLAEGLARTARWHRAQ